MEVGDRPCECSWTACFSLPFRAPPVRCEKGSRCQQRPDPREARVAPTLWLLCFPKPLPVCSTHPHFHVYCLWVLFSGGFPTKSSSQQPQQGQGTALAHPASVTGHLLPGKSSPSAIFHQMCPACWADLVPGWQENGVTWLPILVHLKF